MIIKEVKSLHIVLNSLILGGILVFLALLYIIFLDEIIGPHSQKKHLNNLDLNAILEGFKMVILALSFTSFLAGITLIIGDSLLYPLKKIRIPAIVLTYLLIGWIIYANLTLVPFAYSEKYMRWLAMYLFIRGSYLIVAGITIAIFLQMMFEKNTANKRLLKGNLIYIIIISCITIVSIFALYYNYKV